MQKVRKLQKIEYTQALFVWYMYQYSYIVEQVEVLLSQLSCQSMVCVCVCCVCVCVCVTGYSSAADLLKAMPRVVSWKFSEKDKEYRIYGIANANNYLPSWLRKFDGQKQNIFEISHKHSALIIGRAASVPPPSSLPRRQPVTPPSRKPVKPVKMVKPVQSLHKGGSEWKRQLMAVHVRFRFGPGSNDIDTSAATVKMMVCFIALTCTQHTHTHTLTQHTHAGK